jgi:hypothetical protein
VPWQLHESADCVILQRPMRRSRPLCDTLIAVQLLSKHIRQPYTWIVCALVAALLIKFGWSLFVFDLPLGYDTGFYRYLFLRHAEGFPPFWITDLEPWARAHPLGLFFFSTIFLKLGIPVDWLIGWMWNLFTVVLLCLLSWTTGKRFGREAGIWTLVACVLSVSTFDGFAAMYWKTFASLLWCVLAFSALERRSWLTVLFGILAVTTHSQTGLLFGLVLVSYLILPFIPWVKPSSPLALNRIHPRDLVIVIGGGLIILCIGLLLYLPVWKEAVMDILPMLLGQTEVSSGSFPDASFYVYYEGLVLLVGILGLVLNIRKERWTPWQLAVLWSFVFVAARLLFYRRFFLQLEFFLLPFAGIGFAALWKQFKQKEIRIALIVLLVVQVCVMRQAIIRHGPMVDAETFAGIVEVGEYTDKRTMILSVENDTPVILRGWYADRRVGGPGLFDAPWTRDQWQSFLVGSHEDRVQFLQQVDGPIVLFVSPLALSFYGETLTELLQDSCFEIIPGTMLYRVICTDSLLVPSS